MPTVKFYLYGKGDVRPIYMRVVHARRGTCIKVPGVTALPVNDWDARAGGQPVAVKGRSEMHDQTRALLAKIKALLEYEIPSTLQEPTLADVVAEFRRRISVTPTGPSTTLIDAFEREYLPYCKKIGNSAGTITCKETTLSRLKSWGEDPLLRDLHGETLLDFVVHLREECGLSDNSIGNSVRDIKHFLSWADARVPSDLRHFKDFKRISQRGDAVTLTKEEFADLVHELRTSEDRNAAICIIGLFTGLRVSSLTGFSLSWIQKLEDGGLGLVMQTDKRPRRHVRIPLHPIAVAAAQQVSGNPRRHLHGLTRHWVHSALRMGAMDAGIITPTERRIVVNGGDKDRVETRPKFQWITPHTMRHTFINLLDCEAGIPERMSRELTGHSIKSLDAHGNYQSSSDEQRRAAILKAFSFVTG